MPDLQGFPDFSMQDFCQIRELFCSAFEGFWLVNINPDISQSNSCQKDSGPLTAFWAIDKPPRTDNRYRSERSHPFAEQGLILSPVFFHRKGREHSDDGSILSWSPIGLGEQNRIRIIADADCDIFIETSIVCELSRFEFSICDAGMLFRECDPEQCHGKLRPVSGVEPQDDHNSPLGSDPLLFSDNG